MPNGKMKRMNLGYVRHKQKLWRDKYFKLPFSHRPTTKGEPLCGGFFSHNDMADASGMTEEQISRGETGKCPHCGKPVRLMVPFFGEPLWLTEKEEIA